jgi:hypothetical protein
MVRGLSEAATGSCRSGRKHRQRAKPFSRRRLPRRRPFARTGAPNARETMVRSTAPGALRQSPSGKARLVLESGRRRPLLRGTGLRAALYLPESRGSRCQKLMGINCSTPWKLPAVSALTPILSRSSSSLATSSAILAACLEHFPKRMNRAGFPCGHESDSRIVLEGRPV